MYGVGLKKDMKK